MNKCKKSLIIEKGAIWFMCYDRSSRVNYGKQEAQMLPKMADHMQLVTVSRQRMISTKRSHDQQSTV